MEFVSHLRCFNCSRTFSPQPTTYTCPDCGLQGILNVEYDYDRLQSQWSREDVDRSNEPGMWRFLPLIAADPSLPRSPLRHGGTPLLPAPRLADELGVGEVWIKDEGSNPTGSLKDRASAVAVVKMQEAGANVAICSSTGNAASSLAGAAASVGKQAVILVPHYAAEGKVAQLLIFGATVMSVKGSYQQAYQLCEEAVAKYGWYNRNCAVNPYLVEGKKTCGLEMGWQFGWKAPDWVVVSVGDGCTIGGVHKGWEELYRLGWIDRVPRFLAVEAEGSPGIYQYHTTGRLEAVAENTIADGISVGLPRNGQRASRAVRESGGEFVLVSDQEIRDAMCLTGRLTGVFAEPAAGAAAAGLRKAVGMGLIGKGERVALVVSGNGMKDAKNAIAAAGRPAPIDPSLASLNGALPAHLQAV